MTEKVVKDCDHWHIRPTRCFERNLIDIVNQQIKGLLTEEFLCGPGDGVVRTEPRPRLDVTNFTDFLDFISMTTANGEEAEAIWEEQQYDMYIAQYNITLACLLIVIILVMYTALSSDVTSMVVQPIESMVSVSMRVSMSMSMG